MKNIHKQLVNELKNYIISQYFSKSPVLLEPVSNAFKSEGLLYKNPYVESSPAYTVSENGISNSKILPEWLKDFFCELSSAGLGVYTSPYTHQITALENAYSGKDLFVSTGTGS